jgi:hypothetical protein
VEVIFFAQIDAAGIAQAGGDVGREGEGLLEEC